MAFLRKPSIEKKFEPIEISNLVKKIFIGNNNYVESHTEDFFTKLKNAQHPEITLLTCSDSRVQVNVLGVEATDQVFVIRNIGNQILPVFGSIDYGVLHLKTPILIIMGHTHCGAILSVFSNYENEPFDIIRELDHLSIPIRHLKHQKHNLEKDWLTVVEKNIDYQVKLAVKKYQNLVDEKQLTVLGVIDDFINVYNSGLGRLILININGTNDINEIKTHEFLSQLNEDYKNLIIKRAPDK